MSSRTIAAAGALLTLTTLIAQSVQAESIADVYAKITTPGVRAASTGDVNQIDGRALHGFDRLLHTEQGI